MEKHIYLGLTHLTIVFHLLFIVFVVIGGFFATRKRWVMIAHIGCVAWAVYAELSPGVICPLTSLENYFGYRAGLSTYEDDFITRYLVPIIYQESLNAKIQFIIVGVVIFVNIIAYRYGWIRNRKV